MTLLDAYALVAFLVGGPAASQVRALLREGDALVATANLAEALDVSQRLYGLPIVRAARIRAEHYHRATRPISLGDAILVASATADSRIATADPDVLAVATAEGIATVELPGQG